MDDITINSHLQALKGLSSSAPAGSPDKEPDGPSFADTLAQSLEKVNDLQKEADQAITEFASGETGNIHETMIAVNKADLAFRLTMQVRNKIVEAYNEVLRMQV